MHGLTPHYAEHTQFQCRGGLIGTAFGTQSNSFGGSYLVDKALSLGNKVIGISRSEEPKELYLKYKKNINLEIYLLQKRYKYRS